MSRSIKELRIAVAKLELENQSCHSTIETQMDLIESLCGEIYELKAEVSILQTIISTYIPDISKKSN